MNEPEPTEHRLIFDWRHRSRTTATLALFLAAALTVHLVCFYLFTVRMPVPAREMPLPATVSITGALSEDGLDPVEGSFPLSVPVPAAGLELPPLDVSPEYLPSFANHHPSFSKWPDKPSPLAWPDVSGMSKPVLPTPSTPGTPSEQ